MVLTLVKRNISKDTNLDRKDFHKIEKSKKNAWKMKKQEEEGGNF